MIANVRSILYVMQAPGLAIIAENADNWLTTDSSTACTTYVMDAMVTAAIAGWFSEHYGISVAHSSALSSTCVAAKAARVVLDRQLVNTIGGLRGIEWVTSIHVTVYVIASNIHILIRYEVV